jgi:hypothetical protein
MEKELSYGERLIGISANSSGNEKVDKANKLFAEAADLLKSHILEKREKEGVDIITADLFGHAICEILNAQLCTVKVLTFSDTEQ